ncbi:hypothetical protein AWB68_08026 [Caballeronia choica]|uniref:Uncharacterized protein n=1 Tax=Caballeronia choica TaxID=326476 RepID=A0A158L0C9_9BURK|nr:hypothetical protein [Caballeronia choica]SAL86433.1 hypothetical protein AWB68_08026 [Caballeronia choica]
MPASLLDQLWLVDLDHDSHRLNAEQLPNPILYSYLYLKAERFRAEHEHELRVTLSAIRMGKLAFGGEVMELPPS